MPWTTIQDTADSIDDEIASFESGVTSIDDYEITSTGANRVVAVIQYTA